jgi:DNA-binding transcriptional regulator GbsR (MarR family)
MASNEDNQIVEGAELQIADRIGRLMEFWGFKRAMGRIWTVLYLSPEALPAALLGERLTMSGGAVSMALAELLKWGVVKRSWKPGDRRDFYEAEVSIWKLVSRVLRERELAMVKQASEDFSTAEKSIAQIHKRATGPRRQELKFTLDRISQLLILARLGETLLGGILSGDRIDPGPIRSFLLGR